MDKAQICTAYQALLRQVYPDVDVIPSENEWNPSKDEWYNAFFIPDEARGEKYYNNWHREGGWHDQVERLRLPLVIISPVYESEVKKHYAHLFPEVFGKSASAKSKSAKARPSAKRKTFQTEKSRVASVRK